MKERLAEMFITRTRAEWTERFEGTDICFAPVLSMAEAPSHGHLVERSTFVEIDGVTQPAPAPRFSRTPAEVAGPPPRPGRDTDGVLADIGIDKERVDELRAAGVIA
jgi:alpha-methylacyl-CoA racemase